MQIGPGIKWIIRQFRIFEAIKTLEAGERVDMAALAYELGYSSQSHFSNHFKAMTGTSPSEYARLHRNSGKT
jgi:AraC-like DNA-binding protein